MTVTPALNRRLSLAHWGTTNCMGRGLLALSGTGNLFSIELSADESYIVHPANILAYSISSTNQAPQPYRFKSSQLNLQVPSPKFTTFFPHSTSSSSLSRFIANIKKSDTYLFLTNLTHRIRTWSRRTIWGDRLFLHFTGPTTILIQSRASRVSDVLTRKEVDEIAEAPPGVVQSVAKEQQQKGSKEAEGAAPKVRRKENPPKLSIATVQRDGKVRFEETDDFEGLNK